MKSDSEVVDWLLAGDPAIRWQVQRDLLGESPEIYLPEQQRTQTEGWGAELLSLQDPDGKWGGGLYSYKWTSTTYSLLLMRRLGIPAGNSQALRGCQVLLDSGLYPDGGINFFKSFTHSETCITGMVLSITAHFQVQDDRIHTLAKHLLEQQMPDGGWNCESYNGATHSSLHTTISVLEGLSAYETMQSTNEKIRSAQARGREFLLRHRLFKSDHTGEVIDPQMTRFSFPPRWYYDVLRGLDYFQAVQAQFDERVIDSIELLLHRRKKDGRWVLQNYHTGRTFFELEQTGKPSRWNTLRALRVLKWWEKINKL